MARPATLTIDSDAFSHNLQIARQIAPNSSIMAIVKADAYGHRVKNLLPSFQFAEALGVCCLEEGLELRELGVTNPILLLEGLFAEHELADAVQHQFSIVIHHADQLTMLQKAKLSKPIDVWLKIDTGMRRLGFAPEQAMTIWNALQNCPAVNKTIYLMTHFAGADNANSATTSLQIACFNKATRGISAPRCLANSAGILAWPESHADWVRPGIMLYGISPFSGKIGAEFGLRPVMALASQLIAIHACCKGDAIGYNGIWRCPQDMLIGVVAMGYHDGYPRDVPNGTPALVNGKTVPLVGRVSMDMLTVDLSTQPKAKVGDPVILWGKGLPVEKIAEAANTIPYELLCRVNKRVIS